MKKLIYSAAALAMAFFAASCQQENLEPVAQESTVTFSVELPGVQTKAIGDGFNVDQLVYEVWKTEAANERDLKDVTKATRLYQETATMAKLDGEQKTVISLNLVHDQNYTILFWAQNSKAINETEPAYVTDDLTAVTYKKAVRTGEYLSNNENMAAFYNVAFLTKTEIEQPSTRRVELKRPFAQLNIGTKNTVEEYTVTMNKSKVKIANVPTTFDVAQNIAENREKGIEAHPAVTDTAAFVFEYAILPNETLVVNDTDYDYVAMNYIFADGNVDVQYWIDATLTATDPTSGRNTETKATVYNFVPEVPLKENYRTNIVGNLLSSNTKYEVVIDASWDDVKDPELNDDGYVVEVWDKHYIQQPPKVNGVYEISLASELAWVAASVNGTIPKTKTLEYEAPVTFVGETFKLVEDIDLTGALWSPIGNNKAQKYVDTFRGTFDGNGHVIKNMTVKNPEVAGLFGYMTHGTVKNVTIDGFDLEANHYAGAIVGWVEGKITVDRCTVKNGQIDLSVVEKDLGDKAGGIVGFAHNGTYTGNTVDNVVINGYRDLGGIAGCLQSNGQVINNTVKNSVITADQIPAYEGVKDVNAGECVGRINSESVTIEDNIVIENVTVIRKVDNTEELAYAVEEAQDGDVIYVGDGQVYMPAAAKGRTLQIEGIHAGATINVASSGSEGCDYTLEGSTVTFTKVNILTVDGNYKGYARPVQLTFNECTFPNTYSLYGNQSFSKCTFNVSGDKYNVWTWGANEATFETCTFNCDGKSVLLYGYGPTELVMNGCTFNDNGDDTITGKAAIEIGNDYNATYSLTVNNATVNGFAINPNGTQTGTTLWANKNSMTPDKLTVIIDGVRWEPKDPNTHDVYNLDELLKWAYMANNGQPALNLNLHADITLPAYVIAADGENQTYVYTDTPITVTDGVPSGSNWVPVGNTTVKYSGMINGNGHTITGLRLNDETRGYIGFVGVIDGGSNMDEAVNYENIYIENLGFDGAVVYTTKSVSGVVAGYVRNIKGIKNCDVTNSTISGNSHTGGVVGYLYTRESDNNVVFSDNSTDADTKVNGAGYVGGLVGYHYASIIVNCENKAEVKGTGDYVGGITGYTRDYHHNRSAYIIACRNTGNVTSTAKLVGGIAGYNLYDAGHQNAEACVVACSSTARVISGSKDVALLVGKSYANSGTVINDCHYGSWALTTPSVTTLVNGGETHGCYAFDPTTEFTQTEIDAMNAAIDQYNTGRAADDPAFCPYKWVLTAGGPELQ